MGKRKNSKSENWSYGRIARTSNMADKYLSKNDIRGKPAYESLRKYNNRLARKANTRLSALKKAGRDYYAYDVAQAFTLRMYNTTRFKQNLKSANDMKKQILAMQRFLKYETSTVEGHKAVEERRRLSFRTKFPQELDESQISDAELDGFLRFLGSSPLRTTIFEAGRVSSGGLVDLIRGQYFISDAEGRDELKRMFERYRKTVERRSYTLSGDMLEDDLYYDELETYLRTGKDPTTQVSK